MNCLHVVLSTHWWRQSVLRKRTERLLRWMFVILNTTSINFRWQIAIYCSCTFSSIESLTLAQQLELIFYQCFQSKFTAFPFLTFAFWTSKYLEEVIDFLPDTGLQQKCDCKNSEGVLTLCRIFFYLLHEAQTAS